MRSAAPALILHNMSKIKHAIIAMLNGDEVLLHCLPTSAETAEATVTDVQSLRPALRRCLLHRRVTVVEDADKNGSALVLTSSSQLQS